jgi:CheY-like chemotaxis protein
MSQPRVLVVDDERFFREAIREVLEGAGFACALASCGEEALELAEDPEVGVVVLDLQLPDIHGLEVFRRLKKTRADLRVVILSASTEQEHVLEGLRLGAFDYLAKPLHEEELALAVRRAGDTWQVHAGWSRLRGRLAHLERTLLRLAAEAGRPGEVAIPEAAVAAVEEVLGAGRASLLLLEEGEGALRVAAVRGTKLRPDEMDAVRVGEGAAGLAAARGEAFVVPDASADARFAGRAPDDRYRTSSFAVAPLVEDGRTFGVLCATDRTDGPPLGDEDLSLLRILAGQVAQLLAEARPVAVEDWREQTQELPIVASLDAAGAELMREICEAVTVEVEPARILDAALRPVAARLRAAPVSLFLIDPTRGDLVREAERDGGLRSDRARLARGRGLTGFVLETGQIVASDAPASDPRFDPALDTPEDGVAGPLLCGPLRFRGRCLGVFRAFPELPGHASPEAGELVSAALSAALRSALLYRSLVDSIDEVARARRGSGRP